MSRELQEMLAFELANGGSSYRFDVAGVQIAAVGGALDGWHGLVLSIKRVEEPGSSQGPGAFLIAHGLEDMALSGINSRNLRVILLAILDRLPPA